MIRNDIALTSLQDTFHRIYSDEFPSFVDTLKSTQNLPVEFSSMLKAIEDNIKKSKTLLAPVFDESQNKSLAGVSGGLLGGVTGGIFAIISKKQAMKKLSGKKLVTVQDSASLFENTIKRMEHLLENTQKDDSSQRNYEQLTSSEKNELLNLSELMKNLSEKLNEELAA